MKDLEDKYPQSSSHQAENASNINKYTSTSTKLKSLLDVDYKHLDASLEMKKMFGSKVISAAQSSSHLGANRGRYNQRTQQLLQRALPRSHLSNFKPTWPPPTHAKLDGIEMRQLTKEEMNEGWRNRHKIPNDIHLSGNGNDGCGNWWTFEHAPQYRSVQHQFLQATTSFDPNTLMALLQVYPYHVDTLLQVSDVFRMQGDGSTSADFVERVLFAIERGFSNSFNVTSGQCRLDFDAVENRSLWLAIHRQINNLCQKGCWRTAFEYAKVMFSLDPLTDPHGALLWLDFLSVKSGQYDWIINVFNEWPYKDSPHFTIDHLPGLYWSKALATYLQQKNINNETIMSFKDAIMKYPFVLERLSSLEPTLLDQSQLTKLKELRKRDEILNKYAKNYTDQYYALCSIYLAHSYPLYRDPTIPLKEIISIAFNEIKVEDVENNTEVEINEKRLKNFEFGDNIARHIIVNDLHDCRAFMPPSFDKRIGDSFDPIPPLTYSTQYDQNYFSGVRLRGGRTTGRDDGNEGDARGLMGFIEMLLRGEFNANNFHGMDLDTRLAIEEQINQLREQNIDDVDMPGTFTDNSNEEESEEENESRDEGEENEGFLRAASDRFARAFGFQRNQNDNDNVD